MTDNISEFHNTMNPILIPTFPLTAFAITILAIVICVRLFGRDSFYNQTAKALADFLWILSSTLTLGLTVWSLSGKAPKLLEVISIYVISFVAIAAASRLMRSWYDWQKSREP